MAKNRISEFYSTNRRLYTCWYQIAFFNYGKLIQFILFSLLGLFWLCFGEHCFNLLWLSSYYIEVLFFQIATEEKDAILGNIPIELKEKGSVLYTTLLDGKVHLMRYSILITNDCILELRQLRWNHENNMALYNTIGSLKLSMRD